MENRTNPVEYRRKKNEEKDRLFQKLNRCTEEIMQDEKAYQRYLDTQAILNLYSVANTLLIADRDIGATQLKSFSDWNEQGIQVKKGEQGILLFEPYEYIDKEGNSHCNYRTKRVFDVSQTTGKNQRRFTDNLSERVVLKALMTEAPVTVEVLNAVSEQGEKEYSKSGQTIFVKKGLSAETLFQILAKETCLADLSTEKELSGKKREDISETVSYLLCRRYGFQPASESMAMPEYMKTLSLKEVREELNQIRESFSRINGRVYDNIEKKRVKDKERQEAR